MDILLKFTCDMDTKNKPRAPLYRTVINIKHDYVMLILGDVNPILSLQNIQERFPQIKDGGAQGKGWPRPRTLITLVPQ